MSRQGGGKDSVFPAHHKGLYATFGAVVGEFQSVVLQIVQCLAQGRLWGGLGAGLICSCQQSVQNRFLQFQPLGITFFRCQLHERLLQLKQSGAATLAGGRQRILPFLFGQRLQRFVKFWTGMSPAAHYPDILGQFVTPGSRPHAASRKSP